MLKVQQLKDHISNRFSFLSVYFAARIYQYREIVVGDYSFHYSPDMKENLCANLPL